MLEAKFQAKLIVTIKEMLPGALVIKQDSSYVQGIPDLLILFKDRWAMLEVKAHADAEQQPNQSHYVDLAKRMSFAAFIYPENEAEVLDALQAALQPRRKALASKSK